MGVSYNLGQLIICLETWLWTHEKKFLAALVSEKDTFLSISPQPQIGNWWNLACLVGNSYVHLHSIVQKII
jgi:hypothetical protein